MNFSPLRLLSPIQLFICLILFFLPWVEVQCVMPKDGLGGFDADPMPGMKAGAGKAISSAGPRPFITQSGLQIATGGHSFASPELKMLMDEAEKSGKKMGAPPGKGNEKDELGKGVILFLFPILILVGGVLGIVLGPGLPRRLVVAGCCAGAIGVVGIQAAIGFPIEQQIKKEAEKEKEMAKQFGGDASKVENPFKIVWKFPLYLTLLLLVGATGTAFVDGGVKKRKPKRVSYDFDDDEDDEEYEDDRPRRKKKPIVEEIPDDDEEERPRKQRRPRDDDDEEDDRPRRKRRRDDDD
ncbi:hypothetical protein VT84_30895 [Gemmata sp. SH-PL17]|uniref:hypothetical protein n=1 Tax=Gemmata sp. SH-PL17 TaxID=1630693 RepID=UPI00078C7DFD|nr:hypothetical protein [Gemmata sp. SH-PL17]AMV28842.1 hypothetical protein VT84_30895 [Gemmata sp. SH-PL17]